MHAQLASAVLGVLMVTSEYATGQIRATLAATPQRLTGLAAKASTFVGVVFVVGLIASFGAFDIGQAIFSPKGIDASLSDPGVLRALIGGALTSPQSVSSGSGSAPSFDSLPARSPQLSGSS